MSTQSLAKQGLAQTDILPIRRDFNADLQAERYNLSEAIN